MSLILLVDDDSMFAESIQSFLETIGHTVIYERTSQDALALAGPAFDLILSDVNLKQRAPSELNGDELVPLLRERYPDARICLWSGLIPPNVAEADITLTKDKIDELLEWIEDAA